MNNRNDNWVHLFQILNVGKHKDGFTLYEVTSMVYPKVCPDAIIKVVVWKRFNDFKYLHKDLKKRSKDQSVTDRFPKLAKSSYFRRFSEAVIEERKKSALEFLEFVGKYPIFFTSDVFVKFFESSYVPIHQIKGNIDAIRDELHLPLPPDMISVNSLSSDDDKITISDTDSVSTRSSFSITLSSSQSLDTFNNIEFLPQKIESLSDTNLPSIPELNTIENNVLKTNKKLNDSALSDEFLILDSWLDKPEIQYMIEAADHIAQATEYEISKNYEDAFSSYKLGIASLLNGAKNDPDLDRREAVRHKVAKYLLKAEKIYNIYLNFDIEDHNWNDNISMKIADSLKVERPLCELSSIEIVDILSSVMLVRYKNTSELYVIKVIRRNSLARHDLPILPLNLPFIVKLYKYFCTENSIYVLLQCARGGMLWNYFKNRKLSISNKELNELNEVPELINENDTDDSYKDLIKDYCSKQKNDSDKENTNNNSPFESIESMNEMPKDDTQHLLKSSQELLESVSDLLEKNKQRTPPLMHETVDINTLELLESRKIDTEYVEDCWSEECIMQWPKLSESTVIVFASQLFIALESLHRLGIICYDLQPKNLLLDENGNLLLSYMYYWENININRCPEYPALMYTAPELSTISPVTKAVDWWSFGVILYEMLTSLNFYKCHPGIFTPNTVLNIPKFVSQSAESLLTQLLVYSPEDRLGYGLNGAENIKSHPFFANVNWRQISQRN